jgi:hypothetical protein
MGLKPRAFWWNNAGPKGFVMSPSRQYYHSVDPETLALLEITLNETWKVVRSKGTFDAVSTRTAIADLALQFAHQGQRDPRKLKALVLAALPSYA